MQQKDLEQMKMLKNEIRLLQQEIDHPVLVSDSVRGSMTQFPYIEHTIVVEGVDVERDDRLRRRLVRKVADLQDLLVEMEEWLEQVPDSEARQILRLRYRNGLSQEQIGAELGYDRSIISRKIKQFWQE